MLRLCKMVLTVAVCAYPASAATADTGNPVTTALLRAAVEQKVSTPSERQALVQAARNYCEALGRVYPRNSPSEDAWLKGEIATGGERAVRVVTTAEFGRRMAANFVDACIYSAKAYQAGGDNRRSILWLAYAFAHYRQDADYFAKKNGVDADRFALGFIPGETSKTLILAAIQE